MSIEDETELKDLLLQTLTENGSLAKIKAQLRASVFLALEEDSNLSSQKPFLNERVKSGLKTTEGQLMFCIVKEFLEYFNLQSTMAVFDAESYLGLLYDYKGRTKLSTDLGLNSEDESAPLLQHIVNISQHKPRTLQVNLNMNETNDVIDNDSTSTNSIKTESSMSEEFSETGMINMKNIKNSYNLKEVSGDLISESNHRNEFDETLNKTYITERQYTLNNSEDFTNSNNSLMNDIQGNISDIGMTQVSSPLPSLDKFDEVTTPVLRDSKVSPERVKSPPKSEKLKSKTNLNSLSDLPPLTMNRSLSGKILPSLYNKEIREKPNS